MSHLSNSLRKYYSRETKKIVFRDGRSLNQLALAMWTELGFQQIDASVLSRVLKGERLFTGQQLKVFCTLLQLLKSEEEYLYICLEQDLSQTLKQYVSITHVSSSLALDIARELTDDVFDMFYRAEYQALKNRYELIRQLAGMYALTNSRTSISELLGLNLYLHGRTILHGSPASRAVRNVSPIFKQLLKMNQMSDSKLLYGYAYALLSDAYYGAGGYSDLPTKRKFYVSSISFAQKAIDNLPDDDREGLFALRTIVASAHYLHDEQIIRYAMKRARSIIPKQPQDNYVNTLHLSVTLGKALAASRISDPFVIQDIATNYFKRDLARTGLHEISGIREEISTLLILKTQDKNYIEDRLQLGIELATEFKFLRHKRHLNKLLRQLKAT